MKCKFLFIFCLILFTGCSNTKTLSCEIDSTGEINGQGTAKEEIKIEYDSDGKDFEEISRIMTLNFDSVTMGEDEISNVVEQSKKVCDENKDNFTLCEVERDKNRIVITISMDKDKAGSFMENVLTYDEMLKLFEDDGYSCK